MADGYRWTITGRSNSADNAVSSGPPKSPPHWNRQALGLQPLNRLVVRDSRKRRLDALERRRVAFEHLELARATLEHTGDDRDDERLGQIHHVVDGRVGHLRLDHPELGEVASRLGLLGAERRAEAVHAAERHRVGFVVQLPALREIRRLVLEVLRREQRRRALAGRGRENRRVGENEAAAVEEIADGVDDLVANPQDGLLPLRADPEMAAVEEKVDAVLLRRNRIVVRRADDLQALDVDLVAARRPLVGACRPRNDDRRFLAQMIRRRKQLVADGSLRHHGLNEAGTVAQDEEMNLPARTPVVQPPLDGDLFTLVLADVFDENVHSVRSLIVRLVGSQATFHRRSSGLRCRPSWPGPGGPSWTRAERARAPADRRSRPSARP